MADGTPQSPPANPVAGWGKALLDKAVLAIPISLITEAAAWVYGKTFAQPWQILWVALPLTVLVIVAWKVLRSPQARRFDLRFTIFLGCFATLFAVLSAADFLAWKRTAVAGFPDGTGHSRLLPNSWGDWRYWLVRDVTPPSRLFVLLQDPHDAANQERTRSLDALIMRAGLDGGALGVFFDVSYSGHSRIDDRVFCPLVDRVSAKIPVMTAYHYEPIPGTTRYKPVPPPDPLQTPQCLLESAGRKVHRAHSMVLTDIDKTVRSIPLSWSAAAERSALSVRIAQCMHSGCDQNDLNLPESGLLRFLPNITALTIIKGDEEISAVIAEPSQLENQFLLVGERSPRDQFMTPGDDATPGVLIHAYAVNSLLSGKWFTRPPAWFSAFVVIAACGILSIFALRNAGAGLLALVAVIETLVIVALAAIAAKFQLVWLDVIYALVALWLLLPLLIVYLKLAATQHKKPAPDDRIELIDPEQ